MDKTLTRQQGDTSRIVVRAVRVLAAVQAALILTQGALAGSHLTGGAGALDAHRLLGTVVLGSLGLAIVIVAAFAFRRARWLLVVSGIALLGLWAQIDLGFLDVLGLHLPLGIALFGTYLILAVTPGKRSVSTTKENQ